MNPFKKLNPSRTLGLLSVSLAFVTPLPAQSDDINVDKVLCKYWSDTLDHHVERGAQNVVAAIKRQTVADKVVLDAYVRDLKKAGVFEDAKLRAKIWAMAKEKSRGKTLNAKSFAEAEGMYEAMEAIRKNIATNADRLTVEGRHYTDLYTGSASFDAEEIIFCSKPELTDVAHIKDASKSVHVQSCSRIELLEDKIEYFVYVTYDAYDKWTSQEVFINPSELVFSIPPRQAIQSLEVVAKLKAELKRGYAYGEIEDLDELCARTNMSPSK